MTADTRRELNALLTLALPLIVSRVGMVTMGIVDTVVAGRLGRDAMASLALGSTAQFLMLILAMGTLMGMEPVVANAVGADDEAERATALRTARWLAIGLGLPVVAGLFVLPHLLLAAGEPAHLIPVTADYLRGLAPGIIPALLFSVASGYLSATHRNRALLWIALGTNLLNLAIDLTLGLGYLGAPKLGVEGIAWATSACHTFNWLAAGWFMLRGSFAPLRVSWGRPTWAMARRILQVGAPVGVQYTLEVGAFSLVTFWMGLISVEALAGHQIAMNVISATFTAALGFSVAAGVRVGFWRGRGELDAVRRSGVIALATGLVYAVSAGALIYVLRTWVAALYTDDVEVIRVAAVLLGIAVLFQLADTFQAIGFGILRGLEDTFVPALFNIVGYWLLGLPLGYVWAFHVRPGPAPLWWGLSLALYVIAAALAWRFVSLTRRQAQAAVPTTGSEAP